MKLFCFDYSDVKTSRDTSIANARGRGRGRGGVGAARSDRGKASGPGNKAPRNAIVASSGLFSEGAGDGAQKRLFRSFRGQNDDSTTSSLRRPTLSTKREKVDPQVEQKHISEIYDLDATDTPDASASDFFSPVNLCHGKIHHLNEYYLWPSICNFCYRFTVKSEVKLEERINDMDIQEKTDDTPIPRLKYPASIGEFFDRTEPQLVLMQVKIFQIPSIQLELFLFQILPSISWSLLATGCTARSWNRIRASR